HLFNPAACHVDFEDNCLLADAPFEAAGPRAPPCARDVKSVPADRRAHLYTDDASIGDCLGSTTTSLLKLQSRAQPVLNDLLANLHKGCLPKKRRGQEVDR